MGARSVLVAFVTLCIAITPRIAKAEGSMIEEAWSTGGLHGTFARPVNGPERGPAVLIIAGSGPTDRNSNGPQLSTDTYRKLAEGLAASGIRSLRYDKRGIGESRAMVAREEDVTFENFVSDAVIAAKDLSQRSDVTSVILAGHSEGAILALAAATHSNARGIILLCSPGRDLLSVLRAQLKGRLPPDLDTNANAILDTLAAGNRVTDIPQPLQTLFRPSVQLFLISAAHFDPAKLIVSLTTPVLALHAERDLQVMRADFDALRSAKPDARFVILPEANHTLKTSPADPQGNLALYKDPVAPLDPGVMPAMVAFVRDLAR
jgi:pimeloyl-ACP methyl ester carboxylesterase